MEPHRYPSILTAIVGLHRTRDCAESAVPFPPRPLESDPQWPGLRHQGPLPSRSGHDLPLPIRDPTREAQTHLQSHPATRYELGQICVPVQIVDAGPQRSQWRERGERAYFPRRSLRRLLGLRPWQGGEEQREPADRHLRLRTSLLGSGEAGCATAWRQQPRRRLVRRARRKGPAGLERQAIGGCAAEQLAHLRLGELGERHVALPVAPRDAAAEPAKQHDIYVRDTSPRHVWPLDHKPIPTDAGADWTSSLRRYANADEWDGLGTLLWHNK